MVRELPIENLPNELNERGIALADANIWDVRDAKDYADGHIQGAVNHPINQGVNKASVADTQGTVYVLCGGGSKAPRAANAINDIDSERDVVVLTGGTRKAKALDWQLVVGDTPF